MKTLLRDRKNNLRDPYTTLNYYKCQTAVLQAEADKHQLPRFDMKIVRTE